MCRIRRRALGESGPHQSPASSIDEERDERDGERKRERRRGKRAEDKERGNKERILLRVREQGKNRRDEKWGEKERRGRERQEDLQPEKMKATKDCISTFSILEMFLVLQCRQLWNWDHTG